MGEDDDTSKLLLVDLGNIKHTSMDYEGDEYGIVRSGTGIHTTKLYEYLNSRRGGKGTAQGYALMHTPAPGDITLGGMLAIGGHGTGIDVEGSDEPKNLNGSVSNMVLSLTALVWNDTSKAYELTEFKRGDGIIDVLMVGLGRILITEVTMQVVPNYNLRCTSRFDISADELFHEDENYSKHTIASLTKTHGRMEVIWFPYTNNPWLKVWEYSPTKPQYSVATTESFNYRITELAPKPISRLVTGFMLSNPDLTPAFGVFMRGVSDLAVNTRFTPDTTSHLIPRTASSEYRSLETQLLDDAASDETRYSREQMERLLSNEYIRGMLNAMEQAQVKARSSRSLLRNVSDIWGPAYHTLLYVTEHTLRVTANGYAVHLPFSEVQTFLYQFKKMYSALLTDYEARGLYPVNGPIEIRITGFSETSAIKADGDIKPPALCALQKAEGVDADVAVWLDLLGLTNTPSAGDFFTELETWLYDTYPPEQIKVEWSKGWAYSSKGAWSSDEFLNTTLPSTLNGSTRSMKECVEIFNQLDPNGLMSNAFLDKLLS